MLAFFYGENVWAVKAAVKQVVAAALAKLPGAVTSALDLEQPEKASELLQDLKNDTLFASPKVVIATGLFASPVAAELLTWLGYYANSSADNLAIILWEAQTKAALEKKAAKTFTTISRLAKPAKAIAAPKAEALAEWAKAKFDGANIKIQPAALRQLLAAVGESPAKLENEADKLIAYANSASPVGELTSQEVGRLVATELPLNNFALIDAVAEKNTRQAVELWHRYLVQGEDPYAFLGLLIYQFRNLLRVKALSQSAVTLADMPGQVKLHPFVLRKTHQQARGFELKTLVSIYQALGGLEVGFKTGQIDLVPTISKLILEIGNSPSTL